MIDLDSILPQLPADKANHACYGVLWGLLGALIAKHFGVPTHIGALALAAAAGVGKEIYDKVSGKGDPSVQDAIATFSGGVAVALAVVIG